MLKELDKGTEFEPNFPDRRWLASAPRALAQAARHAVPAPHPQGRAPRQTVSTTYRPNSAIGKHRGGAVCQIITASGILRRPRHCRAILRRARMLLSIKARQLCIRTSRQSSRDPPACGEISEGRRRFPHSRRWHRGKKSRNGVVGQVGRGRSIAWNSLMRPVPSRCSEGIETASAAAFLTSHIARSQALATS